MAKKKVENYVLNESNVVKLRNGYVGAVGSFNEKNKNPWIIFKAYMSTIDKYDEKLKSKGKSENTKNYDIVAVYDGSNIDNVKDIFKAKFNVEELPLLWQGND